MLHSLKTSCIRVTLLLRLSPLKGHISHIHRNTGYIQSPRIRVPVLSFLHQNNLLGLLRPLHYLATPCLDAPSRHPGIPTFPSAPGVSCLQLTVSCFQLATKVNALLGSIQHMVNATVCACHPWGL